MNLVDSSGWLEYFADAPNADFFASPIEDVENLLVPTICILEVFRRVLQQRDERAALQVVATMQQGHVVEMNAAVALLAARLGVDLKLPLADSIILATARMYDAIVWTQDADFKVIEGVKYKPKRG
jgi:predicted nucleic acid-binding protein